MYLGFWRLDARKPPPLLEVSEKYAPEVSKSGLVGYSEYKGWYSVMYVNPKTDEDFEGWLDSRRLESTGTMGPKS